MRITAGVTECVFIQGSFSKEADLPRCLATSLSLLISELLQPQDVTLNKIVPVMTRRNKLKND
jgi:hypothetical protein